MARCPCKSVKDKLKHDFDSSMVKVGFENQDVKKKIAGPPLCAKHGLPVLASRLLARCRTSGCTQCEWDRRNIRRKQTTVPSPKLRKCKRHGLPITPYYWRVGYRTKGCTQCGNERRHQTEAATKVPTPANRLCKRHGLPSFPVAGSVVAAPPAVHFATRHRVLSKRVTGETDSDLALVIPSSSTPH